MKCIICDLDGSLMNPSSGLYVKEEVQNRLIQLQEKGYLVILNSARIFQGVLPLAHQIKMNEFGGYVISCNGASVYDVKKKEVLFEYPIASKTIKNLWNLTLQYHLEPSYTQSNYVVCHEYTHGYELDAFNCNVDYKVQDECDFVSNACKFSASESQERMDTYFPLLKQKMEQQYDVLAIRSTPFMADVVCKGVDKFKTCDKLLQQLNIKWSEVSYIGDGISDLECVKEAGLGVSLENAKEEVKQVADLIVKSCFEDGCIEWLDMLLEN